MSVPPYAYFVERITGGALEVEVLVPPGANPHIYEPSPKQVEKIISVQLWFRIGEPIENKILTVLEEQDPSLEVIDLTKNISLISNGHSCGDHWHEESKDRHVWMSPKLAQVQAQEIADALIRVYPEQKEAFQKGLKLLLADLKELDRQISEMLAPFAGDAILVSHPAFGYFCQDYDLTQLSIECEGKDPLPQDIAETLRQAEQSHVRAVFTQMQYNNKGAQLIAEKLHLPIYEVDPYSSDYIENLRHIAGLITHE